MARIADKVALMTGADSGIGLASRWLMQCYDAAASFGWSERDPKPGSMRDSDWLIGCGCATASDPTHMAPATARVTLGANGDAAVMGDPKLPAGPASSNSMATASLGSAVKLATGKVRRASGTEAQRP